MSKEEDIKFLKIQTCVLKVNIHCDGCKQKVKKILQKIDGVYTTTIDAEQGKVTVSGSVDPATLIKKLSKAGKHAELLAPKGGNHHINSNSQFQKPQPENGKGLQKDNGKPPNQKSGGVVGGGKDHKGQQPQPTPQQQQQLQQQQLQQQQLQQLQQLKGFKDLKLLPQLKDLKLPFQKDPKSVKFTLPPEGWDEGSDYDEFDDYDDDEDLDDLDAFEADFDDDFKNLKIKPMNAPPNGNGMMADKKGGGGGGNGKKGVGGGDVRIQNKGIAGTNDPKNGSGGGKKGSGGGNQNQGHGGGGKNGGGGPQDNKNVGNSNKAAPSGHFNGNGGNNNNHNIMNSASGGKKGGGGKNDVGGGHPMINPNMIGQGFHGMDVNRMANMQPPMGQMGNIPAAVQGLPAGGPPPGYFQAGGMVANPEMMAAAAAAANPYQQQYMAAMLQQQQQQQQRMMMMNGQDRPFHPMMMAYPRPPPVAMPYIQPMPPQGEPYTNFFSDENTSSCSIM